MEAVLATDEVYIQMMDEYTWNMLAKGSVPEELCIKIHDYLQMRFPIIKKVKKNGTKQSDKKVLG